MQLPQNRRVRGSHTPRQVYKPAFWLLLPHQGLALGSRCKPASLLALRVAVMAEDTGSVPKFTAWLHHEEVIPGCSSLNALCTDDTAHAAFVVDAPGAAVCRLRWGELSDAAAADAAAEAAAVGRGSVALAWRHELATPGQATAILALPGSAALVVLVQGTLELLCAERGECLQCLEVSDALLTAATLFTCQGATFVIAVSMLGDVVAVQVVPEQAAVPCRLAPISRWRLDNAQYTDVALTPGEDAGSCYLWMAQAHCGVDVVQLLPAASWRLEQVAFIPTAGRVRQLCACGSSVLAFTSELAVYMFPPGPGTVELDSRACRIGDTCSEVLRAALAPQHSAAPGTSMLLCTTKANTLDLLHVRQGSGLTAALAWAGSWQLPDWGVGLSLCASLATQSAGTPWPAGASEGPGRKRARQQASAALGAVAASRAALQAVSPPASQPVAGILCGVLSSPPRVMRGTVHQAAVPPAVSSST